MFSHQFWWTVWAPQICLLHYIHFSTVSFPKSVYPMFCVYFVWLCISIEIYLIIEIKNNFFIWKWIVLMLGSRSIPLCSQSAPFLKICLAFTVQNKPNFYEIWTEFFVLCECTFLTLIVRKSIQLKNNFEVKE